MKHPCLHPPHAQPHTARCGSTLVELLAVIGINAALLGIIIAALAALGRADRQIAEKFREADACTPLIARLRADVHAASHVYWDPSARRLQLELADESSIVYIVHRGRWERRAIASAESSPGGELTAAFQLPNFAQPAISPADAGAGDLLEIHWAAAPPPKPLRTAKPGFELVAAVGRDARLLHE